MRIAGLIVALLLLAGCSHPVDDGSSPQHNPSTTVNPSGTVASTPTSTNSVPQTGPPDAGAPVDTVIRWIEAGSPANPADFHTADMDGTVAQLGDDVAFRTPRKLQPRVLDGCMTASKYSTALTCLVPLRDPPRKPAGLEGEWIDGWVEFDGSTITIGGLHGDPGPFSRGNGRPLGYGDRLKFGDYQCRSDPLGLYCVNYAHHSAVRLGDTIVTYGCVKQPAPPRGVGEQFDCG